MNAQWTLRARIWSFIFSLRRFWYNYEKYVIISDESWEQMILYLRMKAILNLHNDLMVAAENLESLYSWSLLFWLGNLSLHIVSNTYFIITWMLKKSWDVVSWPVIYCLNIWLLAFLLQLLLLHIVCDFVSSQVRFPRQSKRFILILSFAKDTQKILFVTRLINWFRTLINV